MTITERLLDLDPTLDLHDEGEWSNTKTPYLAFNDAGVECETGEFLYSMVRILKPKHVLETGTHVGIGASYMGLAAKDNTFGFVETVEFIPENHRRAVQRMTALDLNGFVTCHLMDVAQFQPAGRTYQLILLDTEPQTRFAEAVRFTAYLDDGGFMFIHDLHRHMAQVGQNPDHPNEPFWPWGPIPEELAKLVHEGVLVPFHFPTPRGLTGFYKPRVDDYKWPNIQV